MVVAGSGGGGGGERPPPLFQHRAAQILPRIIMITAATTVMFGRRAVPEGPALPAYRTAAPRVRPTGGPIHGGQTNAASTAPPRGTAATPHVRVSGHLLLLFHGMLQSPFGRLERCPPSRRRKSAALRALLLSRAPFTSSSRRPPRRSLINERRRARALVIPSSGTNPQTQIMCVPCRQIQQ